MEKPILITYEYPPDVGGISAYLSEEVKSFNLLHGEDFYVNVVELIF